MFDFFRDQIYRTVPSKNGINRHHGKGDLSVYLFIVPASLLCSLPLVLV